MVTSQRKKELLIKKLQYYKMGKTLYTDAKLCVLQNGFFSEFFYIGHGCRQGDPILPYLFNICVEIMEIMVKQNRNIRGIHIQKEYCFFQYADDIIIHYRSDAT